MTDGVIDLYADDEAKLDQRPLTAVKPRRLLTPFNLVVLAAAVLVIVVVAWGIRQTQLKQPESGEAANFSLPDVTTGETFTLSEQRGKVVVINFWGTWCVPCRVEAPMLQRTYAAYQDQGVVFVGVAIKDVEGKVLEYLDEFGITYVNVMDRGGKVEDAYRIEGVPETFVVDKKGNIVKFFYAQPNESELRAVIEKALKS